MELCKISISEYAGSLCESGVEDSQKNLNDETIAEEVVGTRKS